MIYKVKINGIAVTHSSTLVKNEFYFEHFKKMGKDVEHFFKDVLGRNERYVVNNEGKSEDERENSLTLQIDAAKKVLKKCNLTGQDIDGIIVATQFPEYMVPPSFMSIHHAIDAKRECFGYDINSNCLGMTMAFEQAGKYILCNDKINRILIVAGDYLNQAVNDDDDNMYGVFGDTACAIIVERTEEESMILDADYFINNASLNTNHIPNCGLSGMSVEGIQGFKDRQQIPPICDIPDAAERISQILERNNLTADDISGFCFSQFVQANNKFIMDKLNIPQEKCPFVGTKYAYTGGNSPFLALNELIESKSIKRGDYLFFWTIGSAMQHIFLLIKY